jgi:hypothetical protein
LHFLSSIIPYLYSSEDASLETSTCRFVDVIYWLDCHQQAELNRKADECKKIYILGLFNRALYSKHKPFATHRPDYTQLNQSVINFYLKTATLSINRPGQATVDEKLTQIHRDELFFNLCSSKEPYHWNNVFFYTLIHNY